MKAVFDDETFGYAIDGVEASPLLVKGASAAIARDSASTLSILIQRLQNAVVEKGGIAKAEREILETYLSFQREIKLMQMAQFAIANGGIEQVKDWSRAEEIIAEQFSGNDVFPGLRSFFEDISRGRYGTQKLSNQVLARGIAYAASGRLTYENERLAAQMRLRPLEARRRQGGVERHCSDCPRWALLGWIEAVEMFAKYAIGMSSCVYNCYCVITTRRKTDRRVGQKEPDPEDESTKNGHWNALPAALQAAAIKGSHAKQIAAYGGVLGTIFVLFKYASRSPAAMNYALGMMNFLLKATTY
jgi:hypothetical protein